MQKNVIEYFEAGALKDFPNRIAIVDHNRSLTFKDLASQAKRFAWHLKNLGGLIKHPVAVLLPKCVEVIVADLGIVYSGNIYTNLDSKSPSQRIRNILDNLDPIYVVTSSEFKTFLQAIEWPTERIIIIEDILQVQDTFDDAFWIERLERVIDTDPLCIINTSGSTGTPKGVALNHLSTIDFMDWVFDTFRFDEHTRIGSLSPFYFDIYTLELFVCLAKGATLVLIPDGLPVFPAKLVGYLQDQKITFLFWVPSIMVNISSQGLLEKFDLSSLECIFFAGEVFPMKHLNNWRKTLHQTMFVNLYGPIEITVDCTYFILDRPFNDEDPLPIGFPCRNSDVFILNQENRLCSPGEHGELCVRGSSLALGYWNAPDKTAAVFIQNPLHNLYPELIYRTGDVVYTNEYGEIMFIGRKDFQIKHMGYRIDLSEIEHQVLCIPGLSNACVFYNKARKEITVFYEDPEGRITPALIRTELSRVFPKYMLPTAFLPTKELPRNPNGKIDRNGLQDSLMEPI